MRFSFVVNDPNANGCGLFNVANHCIVKHPDFKMENANAMLIVGMPRLIIFILFQVHHCQ
jgi:hypothetical protein